ncbi:MAG: ABC transporter ATP-binding protein [Deltaproteobacteria bacterium]|nr:ABC transporter ATP-binding protein [Deltaproteobacteria bacterium]
MIQLNSITKEFRSGRGYVQAIRDVSFVIKTGDAVAITGKSGSGKTTLLTCIGGLERPEDGNVISFDSDIYALSARDLSLFQRRHIGFVFQHGNLLSYLTVYENIAFPLILNGKRKPAIMKRVSELLEKIGLPDAGAAMPHELSGGEIQRVSVARAIAHLPRALLADEPTASLDTATGESLVKLLFDMGRDSGCTMILSTHDPNVSALANKVLEIRDGAIVKE